MIDYTDDDGTIYQTTCDLSEPEQPTMGIVRTLSVAEDRCPLEVESLHDAINTDALNKFFDRVATTDARTQVEFDTERWSVAVDRDGHIVVSRRAMSAPSHG